MRVQSLLALLVIFLISCDKLFYVGTINHSKNNNTIFYAARTPVRWYGLSREFKTIEGATITFPEAKRMLRKYIDNQAHLTGDIRDAVAKSMFGLSHRPDSFIEISIDTAEKYRIKHECLLNRKTSLGFSLIFQTEYHLEDEMALLKIIERFFEDDSESFVKYFDQLNLRKST